jgi:hypothetical protein
MPDATYIACPRCGEPYAMTAMQKHLFHGRTLTCQRCAKPFTITEETPEPVPAARFVLPSAASPHQVAQPVQAIAPETTLAQKKERGDGLTPGRMALLITLVAAVVCVFLYFAIAPSIRRSRETANRVSCASNLSQIGTALQMYANTNGGRFPSSLALLVANGSVPAEMLICPSTDGTANPSYVYLGSGMTFSTVKRAIVYEPLTNHHNEGVHVMYTDGTVQFLPRPSALVAVPQLSSGGAAATTLPTTLPTR